MSGASASGPPRRVLIFAPGLPVGGAERHALDLRLRLSERGFHTDLLVHGRRLSDTMLEAPGSEGAVLLRARGMSDPGGWLRTRRALRAMRPDVVFGVNQAPAIVTAVLRATGATSTRVACIFHTTLMAPKDRSRLPLFRAALPALDALVYVSENQRRYWRDQGLRARRDPAIRNGVDLARFRPAEGDRTGAKAAAGVDPGGFVIGMLAALRVEKNHLMMVEAVARLRAQGLPACGLFVGDGPLRPAIEARAAELGVAGHVRLAGEQQDVRPFIAAFDVGALCSTGVETFSLAALELLATGVPMLMSDIGGASEIIEEGVNGFLFDPADLDGLVERLARTADPARLARMRAAARPSVERFHVDRMTDAYAALIDDMLANPRRGDRRES